MGALAGLAHYGNRAQAVAPGLYAWAVTVAPAAWGRGASPACRVAAGVGVLALAAGPWSARRWGPRARAASLWGFVVSCALAWSAASAAMSPLRFGVVRGLTGSLAWGLFAFTWSGPILAPAPSAADSSDEPLVPRRRTSGRETLYLICGAVAAASTQAIGWDVPGLERSLLVRMAELAAGIALVDASLDLALARSRPQGSAGSTAPLRTARPWLVLLGALFVVRALFGLAG